MLIWNRDARPTRLCVLFLVAFLANPSAHFGLVASDNAVVQPSGLKIVVIEGEAGVNIIRQGTAVAPVVEVRDQNNLPIGGVPVTFTIAGQSATFAGGAQTITVATNVAGQATVAGMAPVNAGTFQIGVQATFQGQTAVATITQTNVLTAAQAATVGASGGTSTGSAAGGTGGAAGGGAAGGAAAAGAATGISTGLIVGGIAAAVGGGLVVAKTAGGGDSGSSGGSSGSSSGGSSGSSSSGGGGGTSGAAPPAAAVPPVVSSVSASPDTGLQGATNFTVTAQGASDPAGGQLTFSYDFGDGSTGSGNPASHTYNNSGTFTVRLTVTNPRSLSATASTSVTVKSMTGAWRGTVTDGGPFPATVQATLNLTQSGTSVAGTYSDSSAGSGSITGTLTGTTFNFTLNLSPCVITGNAQVNVNTMVMAGTYPQPPQANCGLSGGTFTMTKQ